MAYGILWPEAGLCNRLASPKCSLIPSVLLLYSMNRRNAENCLYHFHRNRFCHM